MKLPEDKKERTKILALIGLGAVIVAYGLYMGVVSPLLKGKKERLEKIDSIQAKVRKAEKATARMASDLATSSNILSEVDQLTNQRGFVLRDRLGNFLLGATEILEQCAQEAGVQIASIKENGMSQIPQGTARTTPAAFNAYTVTVQLECGTPGLTRFLESLEKANPYLCVSSLAISAQSNKPEKHLVTAEVQWPAWADPKMPGRIAEQLQALADGSFPTAPVSGASTNASAGK
jgi:hypothetical protein